MRRRESGSHEFCGAQLPDALETLRAEGQRRDVHLPGGDECFVSGTRFLGTTLWTDYALYGSTPADLDRAMADAKDQMNDFRMI